MALSYQSLVRQSNSSATHPIPAAIVPNPNQPSAAPAAASRTDDVTNIFSDTYAAPITTVTTDIFSASYVPSTLDIAASEDEGDLFDRITWRCIKCILKILILAVGIVLVWQIVARFYLIFYSTSDHGNTLNQFIANTRYLDYEVHAEFDAFGLKLFENSQYNATRVVFDTEASQTAHLVSFGKSVQVHNHPLQDCPFSLTDLIAFTSRKTINRHSPIHDIVISPNYVYELVAPSDWNPDINAICNFAKQILDNSDSAFANGLLDIYQPCEIDISEHTITYNYVATDLLLERFAEDFGLTYTVTPIEEWSLS